MSTHTQRTLNLLRKRGYAADVVERWIPGANQRRDFLGIIDILAMTAESTLGVQSCGEDFAGHRKKILASERTREWLRSPHRGLVLIGWRKVAAYKKDGSRAALDRWAPRVQYFYRLDEEVLTLPEQDGL